MGILSSIGSFVSKIAAPISKILPTTSVAGALAPKKTTEVATAIMSNSPKTTGAVALGVATLGASALAAPAATSAIVKTAAAAVTPKTIKGAVITAVAAPVIYGAVANNPDKAIETASQLPKAASELADFGKDISKFATAPSLETAKNIIKDSPIISTAAGLALGAAAVKTIAPIVGGALSKGAIEEQTEKLEKAIENKTELPKVENKTEKIAIAEPTPVTPATQPLIATAGAGSSVTRRKRSTKKVAPQQINQKVNILVNSKSSSTGIKNVATKRYINKRAIAV